MKLEIEIRDCICNSKLKYAIGTCIAPDDSREGITTHDKPRQMDKLSRLIDLSEVIKEAVERFYQNRTISSPSASISTSGEPGTK